MSLRHRLRHRYVTVTSVRSFRFESDGSALAVVANRRLNSHFLPPTNSTRSNNMTMTTRSSAQRTAPPRLYLLSLLLLVSTSIQEGSLFHVQAFLPSLVGQRRSIPTTTISETDTWRKQPHHGRLAPTTILHDTQLDREIEENSRRKAKNGGGEVAAGAILGGLILGPFGKYG
jgi:hypothetical protein